MPYSWCYNHAHLKSITFSMCLTNQPTYASSLPTVQYSIFAPVRLLPKALPSIGTTHGRESALIPSLTPLPYPWLQTVPMNGFKDRWLVPQITMSFFPHASSPLTCHLRNFQRGHPSLDYSRASMLNYGVLKNGPPKKKEHLWWYE